ncbi:nitrite reductase large subunit NirB [Cryptosporangium sp. NPDC048952]|uniref:nitrite reductase large subunit NirB n=1 Tax=Cryptosporangium sp. NPDC048952 TaxID=3363961 RepID=UPI00371C9B28
MTSFESRHLVVVGHGMVGQRLVEALTDRDTRAEWRITVLGEETHSAYDRVALSRYLTDPSAGLGLVPDGWYDGDRRTCHLGDPAVAIDRSARTVRTASGRSLTYDALVLATGSRAFVPPVTGADLAGCHVYRTLDDLDRIRSEAADLDGSAVVVGGGLLGLEAAGGLRDLGVPVHVVEFAPHLMPQQVDAGGGEALRRLVEQLGVRVHAGVGTASLSGDATGRVASATLTDDTVLDTQLVVFAAGIRPRDELGISVGLPRGTRGGVLVDRSCRTEDPAIWAIGECAAVEGSVYGLVAPGYAMAEIVADRLLGGTGELAEPDMSTKLKLLGVEVASFGATRGPLDVVFSDPVAGIYKKLVISDDARTLLGGVLVGDASAYAGLRPLIGRALPATPETLLFSSLELDDEAQVCSCNAVTKKDVVSAITSEGATDVASLKACTRAGTSCGSCIPMLKTLLDECGVHVSSALCEHFAYSRAELFALVRSSGITTFSGLIAAHGTGHGCDLCKPVVASILASLGNGYILEGEQAALQDTNDHALANMQRNGTYSVVPRIPGGEITAEKLIVIGEVARDFNLYTKITGGQRIDLFGARLDQLPQIWKRLVDAGFESGQAYGKSLRTVKSCVGEAWCRYGVQDSVGLAIDLELRYRGLRAPHKIKMAVSGCARECAEARSKDIGVIATENGWNLYVAGNGGFRPRHADLFASDLDTETLLTYVDRILMFYIRTGERLQRTAAWLESLDGGLEYLRSVVCDDVLGIGADLDASMAAHVANYSDEWADTLADPERLARFVPFINAPGVTDSSIEIVYERGQPRPARPGETPTLVAGPTLEVMPR